MRELAYFAEFSFNQHFVCSINGSIDNRRDSEEPTYNSTYGSSKVNPGAACFTFDDSNWRNIILKV